jgi:hypothetical protein
VAIDDEVEIVIRDAEEGVRVDTYLPTQLVKLGLSAVMASALAPMPFVVNILTNLFARIPARFEKRFLRVAEELNAQQKRIEDRIPDKKYYESEEFQSLLILILEKIHTTTDDEKLRSFGSALANSGSSEFQQEDKEGHIRTLRDLSRNDLEVLNNDYLKGWTPHVGTRVITYEAEVLSSLSRLAGMGLVLENSRVPTVPTTPAIRTYSLSPFGTRFLKFISSGSGNTDTSHKG